ncbi:ABC transporter ATP-binding protein [Ktedonobacter sp. SOSP1-52]|uniref:ABC transporter ATP-binding protein n=1 Tax=Ktedonobacter sp. SOSP1-52 TaxID=2778366 RepID=UPI001914DB9B|nr:ABC transporter ATP-binding protein [Ktedonobacter sp. SOSP1-52]GHO63174.1 ABC transporter ATP-binding protein [Ktedonobacter sp. SOSP1-52]
MQGNQASLAVTTASPSQAGKNVLRTYDLTKQYGARVAVNQLNLEVRRGEIVGFLGPNGAGKTTSIRMLLGLIAPTSGRVELFGHDLANRRDSVLPHIGALVEAPALYLHLSGRDNLRAVGSVLGGVSQQRIEEVLMQVGLHERQKDRVRTYSLGMKQRLGVGIALLNNPDLLILDEPANGLDPAGIVEMRDLMRRLADEGKTVFLSSHFLVEVQQICSRVIFLNAGRLIADKTVEELTRGQGEFEVRLERAQEALALLQQQPWGKPARLDESGALLTPAPQGSGRELYAFLSQAGFTPESLAPATQNLEEVFFSLMNAHKGDK